MKVGIKTVMVILLTVLIMVPLTKVAVGKAGFLPQGVKDWVGAV
jgi:hypothetical protein